MAALYRGLIWKYLHPVCRRGVFQQVHSSQHRHAQILSVKPPMPKVRLALPSDFEAVMTFNAHDLNFRRQDYMATEYLKCLEDPSLRCLLCVANERPVVFGIGQYGVDKGQSVTIRSIRGHHEVRGRGYTLHLIKTLYDLDPYKTYLTYSARDPQNTHTFNGALSYLEYRTEHHCYATESGLNRTTTTGNCSRDDVIQGLTVSEFCDLFSDAELNDYLYPNNYFVMDTLIAKPMDANRKFILERADNVAIFASRSLLPNKDIAAKNSHQSGGLISYNTWYPCPVGFVSKIELYGQLDTVEDVHSHLMGHAHVLKDNGLWGEVKVTMAKDRLAALMGEAEMKRICEKVGLTCHRADTTDRVIMRGGRRFGDSLNRWFAKVATSKDP